MNHTEIPVNRVVLCIDCNRILGLVGPSGGIQSNLNHHADGYMFCRYRHNAAGVMEIGQGHKSSNNTPMDMLGNFYDNDRKRRLHPH